MILMLAHELIHSEQFVVQLSEALICSAILYIHSSISSNVLNVVFKDGGIAEVREPPVAARGTWRM
jgi:hypothetical protein